MDKEILDILKNIHEGQERTNGRLSNLEEGQVVTNERLSNLEKGQNSIIEKVDNIYKSLQETDVKQGARHLQVLNKLNKI